MQTSLCASLWPTCVLLQASLERVGLDAGRAVARARERSVSRVGRKRARSATAAPDVDAMDVDGGSQPPPKKRIHSSKARCAEF